MANAVHQVFHLPEVLEIILSELPQKDILFCQRVNKSCRDTITCSARLQRALFLLPEWDLEARPSTGLAGCQQASSRRPVNNRLLLRAFPGYYPTVTLMITRNHDADSVSRDSGQHRPQQTEQWVWDVCLSFPAEKMPECSPAVHYPEASWRKMYLSQPPPKTLYLVRRWQRSGRPAMVRETGVAMGDFVEEATKTQAMWHSSYISSDHDWHFEGNIRSHTVKLD